MEQSGRVPGNYNTNNTQAFFSEEPKNIIEENNLGELHVYIPSNSTDPQEDHREFSTRSLSSQSARPHPLNLETPTPPPSRWVETINWAKEQIVSYLETPPDDDLIEATRAFNRLRNPPSDITKKETVTDYMTFVNRTASIGKLGTELLGFPLVSKALGHVATGVGGLSTAAGLVSPDPNFKNLQKETEKLINKSFNQSLDLIEQIKANKHTDPETNSKYDPIQELLKSKKDDYLEEAKSAKSTEEIVTVLENLLDTTNEINDTYHITSSNRSLISPLLEKCNHTAARSGATFQKAETSVNDAIDEVNLSLKRLASKQASEKNISPVAIDVYKNMRIKLFSQQYDLDNLLKQVTDQSSDETERLKTAETIDTYVNSLNYRMFHEHMRDVLSS